MKITDDILKALQNCIDSIGSKNAFARRANIHINTVTKYLTKKTNSINDDTWERLQPLLRPFMHKHPSHKEKYENLRKSCKLDVLSSDQKILFDAFSELPPAVQEEKLLELVKLAKAYMKK